MIGFIEDQFLREGKELRKLSDQELYSTFKELFDLKFALDQSFIVAMTDDIGKITYVNPLFCDISKYSREELLGADHRIINSNHHPKEFFKDMWQTIGRGEIWTGDIKNRAKDGAYYWVKTTIVPLVNEKGIPYQYISIRQDITAQKEMEERIRHQAFHDDLTGLRNRLCFKQEVDQWIRQVGMNESLALIFMDLDRFKFINDTVGHSIGDRILQLVSQRLLHHLNEDADLYRFGGDEFVIVVKNRTKEEVSQYIEKILDLFTRPFTVDDEEYFLTVSVGISLFPNDGLDIEMLLKNTDSALYLAKEKGNNAVKFYTLELQENIAKTMKMERALRQAIVEEEFVLHFQPKMDLKTGEITGAEALIRWNHPELGILSPAEFIPLAEDTGMIIPISEWVLKEACRLNRQWQEQGLSPIRMAVNLSPQLFRKKNIKDVISQILHVTQLDPDYLELEITESIMENPDRALVILQELKELGVHLSIDDFGTGYSSLAHLRRFPIDTLKIDRSFVNGIPSDNGVMVKTIIDMASNLGINVIAEGIETDEQMQFLSQLHCDEGQGYLFSPPVSATLFYELYRKYR